jgi:hypothetical protein
MKITKAHIDFYTYHTAPAWARAVWKGRTPPCVPIPDSSPDPHYAKGNTLNILRGVRDRAGWDECLVWMRRMAIAPGTLIHPEKRAACCLRWLRKLGKELPDNGGLKCK